jgi:peptidyl-prolyl cis-trans isomerase C
MNPSQLALAAFSLAAAFSCASLYAQGNPVATVNGIAIPAQYADFMARQQEGGPAAKNPEQMHTAIRDNLVNREVVVQEAKRSGLLDNADVKTELGLVEQAAIVRIYMRDWLKSNPVTDEEVRKAYDDARASAGGKEYRARHILVDNEDVAAKIIAELKGGASFENLAKQSKDPGSGARGGDLGWALPTVYVKPFSEAMVKLEKGQTTDAPVRTQFGYHVIRLDDVRTTQVPPFEQVQQRIRQQLTQRKVAARVTELRDKAKIQ